MDEVKLRETMAVIRENAERWNQHDWVQGRVNPDTTDWRECGTSLCFAGWRALLDGWRPAYYLAPNGEALAKENFYWPDPDNPRYPLPWPGSPTSAPEIAAESLQLNPQEEEALFQFYTDDIDAMEERVERVIAGDWAGKPFDASALERRSMIWTVSVSTAT